MVFITVLNDNTLEEWIINTITSRFSRWVSGPPFVRREYVFTKEEVGSAKLHTVFGSTAPVDKVEAQEAETEQTCPRCRSGSAVAGAVTTRSKMPRRRLIQTLEDDVLVDAELAEELVGAGCPRSDLLPVHRHDGTIPFYLIWPSRPLPPISPQSEGYMLSPDRPCSVCNRNYAGRMDAPALFRYSRAVLDPIPEDECGFYRSWEYFGGTWLKRGETTYPPDALFGRPQLFATKKCFEILRKRCRKQLGSDPVFPEV